MVTLHEQFRKQLIMDVCRPAPSTQEGRAAELWREGQALA